MKKTTKNRQNITQLLRGVKKYLLFCDDVWYTNETGRN